MSRFDKVAFSALPLGAKFRFHARGRVLTKTSAHGSAVDATEMPVAPDTEVVPEDEDRASPAPAANPHGSANRVTFLPGYVRLDGAFTVDQLAAVLADLKAKRK